MEVMTYYLVVHMGPGLEWLEQPRAECDGEESYMPYGPLGAMGSDHKAKQSEARWSRQV